MDNHDQRESIVKSCSCHRFSTRKGVIIITIKNEWERGREGNAHLSIVSGSVDLVWFQNVVPLANCYANGDTIQVNFNVTWHLNNNNNKKLFYFWKLFHFGRPKKETKGKKKKQNTFSPPPEDVRTKELEKKEDEIRFSSPAWRPFIFFHFFLLLLRLCSCSCSMLHTKKGLGFLIPSSPLIVMWCACGGGGPSFIFSFSFAINGTHTHTHRRRWALFELHSSAQLSSAAALHAVTYRSSNLKGHLHLQQQQQLE